MIILLHSADRPSLPVTPTNTNDSKMSTLIIILLVFFSLCIAFIIAFSISYYKDTNQKTETTKELDEKIVEATKEFDNTIQNQDENNHDKKYVNNVTSDNQEFKKENEKSIKDSIKNSSSLSVLSKIFAGGAAVTGITTVALIIVNVLNNEDNKENISSTPASRVLANKSQDILNVINTNTEAAKKVTNPATTISNSTVSTNTSITTNNSISEAPAANSIDSVMIGSGLTTNQINMMKNANISDFSKSIMNPILNRPNSFKLLQSSLSVIGEALEAGNNFNNLINFLFGVNSSQALIILNAIKRYKVGRPVFGNKSIKTLIANKTSSLVAVFNNVKIDVNNATIKKFFSTEEPDITNVNRDLVNYITYGPQKYKISSAILKAGLDLRLLQWVHNDNLNDFIGKLTENDTNFINSLKNVIGASVDSRQFFKILNALKKPQYNLLVTLTMNWNKLSKPMQNVISNLNGNSLGSLLSFSNLYGNSILMSIFEEKVLEEIFNGVSTNDQLMDINQAMVNSGFLGIITKKPGLFKGINQSGISMKQLYQWIGSSPVDMVLLNNLANKYMDLMVFVLSGSKTKALMGIVKFNQLYTWLMDNNGNNIMNDNTITPILMGHLINNNVSLNQFLSFGNQWSKLFNIKFTELQFIQLIVAKMNPQFSRSNEAKIASIAALDFNAKNIAEIVNLKMNLDLVLWLMNTLGLNSSQVLLLQKRSKMDVWTAFMGSTTLNTTKLKLIISTAGLDKVISGVSNINNTNVATFINAINTGQPF